MSYADLRENRPACYGSGSYNENDSECASCRVQHACRGYSNRSNTPNYRRQTPRSYIQDDVDDRNETVEGDHEGGIVEKGERPIERFVKDAAAGGLRGMFYEMYRFWKYYRIR